MNLDHLRAVQTLLAGLPVTFYDDGQVPTEPTFPYAVMFAGTPDETSTALCGTSNHATFAFQITAVGMSSESALAVADAARALLLDVRPAVAGRSCSRIRKAYARPVTTDHDVTLPGTNRHPQYAVDGYEFDSFTS